jgi:hypothetical protein
MTAGRANISLNYEERFVRAVARDVAEYQHTLAVRQEQKHKLAIGMQIL